MSILQKLEGIKETLETLKDGGFDMDEDIAAVDQAIELITSVHKLVDGLEWNGQSSSDLIDTLVSHGLDVRSPDDCDCDEEEHATTCPLYGVKA